MFLLSEDFWEIKNTDKKGKGIFAKRDIEAGTVIGDYVGKIIPESEEEKYDNGDSFYLMYYDDDSLIYPDIEKPGVHLLNHSCAPTCWMYTYKGHTLYFTLRKVFAGEELTVSYLLSPQDEDCNPCKHVCHCGSILCSNTMHLSPEKFDTWFALDDEIARETNTQREKVKPGDYLQPLSSYPTTIPDNNFYTLFGSTHAPEEIVKTQEIPKLEEIRKMIRESGKTIKFPKINVKIFGVLDDLLITKNL